MTFLKRFFEMVVMRLVIGLIFAPMTIGMAVCLFYNRHTRFRGRVFSYLRRIDGTIIKRRGVKVPVDILSVEVIDDERLLGDCIEVKVAMEGGYCDYTFSSIMPFHVGKQDFKDCLVDAVLADANDESKPSIC